PAHTLSRRLPLRNRPHPTLTLFPYTTLFRSGHAEKRTDEQHAQRQNTPAIHRAEREIPLGDEPARERNAYDAQRRKRKRRHRPRSGEHTSELQALTNIVCRLLLETKKTTQFQ